MLTWKLDFSLADILSEGIINILHRLAMLLIAAPGVQIRVLPRVQKRTC